MRHFFSNDSRPKSVAKSLRSEMARHGVKLSHSDALLLTGRLYGYRNWSDLLANLGRNQKSPDDMEAGEATALARFNHHIEVLAAHGLDINIAADIIRKIGPTSSGTGQPLGREELWVDDAAVAAHLDGLATRIAREAISVLPERHGSWLGFRAMFDTIKPNQDSSSWEYRIRMRGNQMMFGVSDDGSSAILRKREGTDFGSAIQNRMYDRDGGTPDDWGFLDFSPSSSDHPTLETEGARVIRDVFSRLHLPTMRALRSAGIIRETDYEMTVGSERVRSFLHRYPSLADHCLWSLQLRKDSRHLGSARWIEGADADSAMMAMLTGGTLPSGAALSRIEAVAKGLRNHAVTSDRSEVFSTEALEALAHLGPSAIPATKSEMRHLIRSAENASQIAAFGMDATRAFDGFKGNWKAFYEATRRRDSEFGTDSLIWWSDSFAHLICSAFAHTYGIDPELLYDNNFSNAIQARIGPVMMARMSMRDIASLEGVIRNHWAEVAHQEEQRYPSIAEADALAALYALPMPESYHGKSCLEILKQAGYDTDILAGMLKLEPDLNFDDTGLPVMEQRFQGLDPATYAAKPLIVPGYQEPPKPPPRRPTPIVPAELPAAPHGWTFDGREFISTDNFRPSRIRWSDGTNELNGSGPGWYADRGLGRRPTGEKPRCPVRLGRFETPQEAADAITNTRGYHG